VADFGFDADMGLLVEMILGPRFTWITRASVAKMLAMMATYKSVLRVIVVSSSVVPVGELSGRSK